VLRNHIEHLALCRSAALDRVAPLVLVAIVCRHSERDAEPGRLEGKVDDGAFTVLGSFGFGKEERGGEGEALAEGVEHAEGRGALGLVARVGGLPGCGGLVGYGWLEG
jgi:hypothetical protein